ncbi:JAB domain-containing protein [Halothermothrix orenii]|uniref:DNA repair protein RadC n=1 Tax=Halothermothrix orenii (strain H 168 / OCM 544 / DSM 9562) TaxID=373903 RepID=B8CX04_HALOH|nr:JAB domain-containing protein [Halothermothrix orenii]ACL69823.1 DNA repair protein RadC [Halothermothrix orenii H 168]
MINVYCWRCGTKVSKKDILGLGHFDQQIGKYQGKKFIAFKCPKCKKARYQILDTDLFSFQKKTSQKFKNSPGVNNEAGIDIDQVIDFYKVLNDIDTVDNFLEKCEMASDTISTELDKPIVQPLDVYNLFCELNTTNDKRLMILTLDEDNYLITWEFLGEGTNKPIKLDPKTIFHTSFLLEEKTSVIIAENMNDNFTRPSQKDVLVTKRLVKAGKILGIDFLDHIVIEADGYHSYDQLNLI